MTLPSEPPGRSILTAQRGEQGWYAFTIQEALKDVGSAVLNSDGDFGPVTEEAVRAFQKAHGLFVDGEAGPVTQAKMSGLGLTKAEAVVVAAPRGLLRGIIAGETGGRLTVVNTAVVGGVDCCVVQERVFVPYQLGKITHAFSLLPTLQGALRNVVTRRDAFLSGNWVRGNMEKAGRLAAFAHNWPSQGGADFYSQNGHVSNPDAHCTWLPKDNLGREVPVYFPDGHQVDTRQDWAEWYAMGGVHGEGRTTKFVTSWG